MFEVLVWCVNIVKVQLQVREATGGIFLGAGQNKYNEGQTVVYGVKVSRCRPICGN